MFIPFLTTRQTRHSVEQKKLEKRRGGGGGGGGRGGGGGGSVGGSRGSTGSGSSGGSSGRSATSSTKPPPYSPGAPPPPYSVGGGASVRGVGGANGAGGGRSYTIAGGNAFAGRSAGGGTRSQVYGGAGGVSPSYGGRGYGGVGFLPFFPFMFWPVYYPLYPYYYGSSIYGPANNDSRPGGDLQSYTLLPTWAVDASTVNGAAGPDSNTFAVYGDANSVQDMIPALVGNCSVAPNLFGANFSVSPFNGVQFYRGSSFGLHLDGYNNSLPNIEVQDANQNFTIPDVQPAALPAGVNQTYLNCLNTTIGDYVGLVDSDYVTNGASRLGAPAVTGTVALVVVLWNLLSNAI